MGIFEDGYLGAVVRGIGSNQKQQQLLNIFDQISSSCDQPSLRGCESSSPVGSSEALETVSRESPPDMLDGTVPLDHPRAEEIDLHEILDAAMHQSSPPFLLEPSHSSSSSSVKAQVSQQIMAAAPEASAIPRTALTPGDDDQPDDPNHHLVPLSPFSQSVPPSDSVLSTKTWAALKIQKHEPFSANNSDPTTPALQKQSPVLPTYDHPTNSKQQGSKRRKGQQKRVVCVPIAGGGNSSEVLPSDMWAWRKYGQKPIKGSPYPRGYYRCSSSKGCSARKQVERSRADPSMLVVTYTSEHNHAWPAHRNSLAGTTRSKSIDKLRRSSPQPTPAASAAAANSSSSTSDQIPLHLQEHSLILPSAMEVSADAEAFALEDHDNLLVLDSAPLLSSQDQHLFQDLEELPELAAFMDDSFFSYRSAYDDTGSMQGVDPFDLFCWSSSSFQGSEIAGT